VSYVAQHVGAHREEVRVHGDGRGEDGSLSLLTSEGEPKDDLNLPSGTDDLDKIALQIKDMFAEGKGVRITTMTAIGQEAVCAVTEDK